MVLKVSVKDKVKVTRAWEAWGTSVCLHSKAGDRVVHVEELREVQHELSKWQLLLIPSQATEP